MLWFCWCKGAFDVRGERLCELVVYHAWIEAWIGAYNGFGGKGVDFVCLFCFLVVFGRLELSSRVIGFVVYQ